MIAVIYRQHTLGLLKSSDTMDSIDILHASVLRGSPYSVGQAIINPSPENYRQSTLKDFEDYRVMWNKDYEVSNDPN